MKLVTYLAKGMPATGAVDADGNVFDVSKIGDVMALMTSTSLRKAAKEHMTRKGAKPVGLVTKLKLRAPLIPGKIIAIGVNYAAHAAEMNRTELPTKPVVFAKMTNAISHPGDTVTWYADATERMDWEAELAVVIGKKAYRVSEADALKYVGGYTCANDLSAREIQQGDNGKQWVLGKSLDQSCPIGPALVTSDEIKDPQTLEIKCLVNGEVMQHSNTNTMLIGVARLIAHLTHYMTLYPGDMIVTGTPNGVGAGRNPPVFLKHGDEVVVEIEKIGTLRNKCAIK